MNRRDEPLRPEPEDRLEKREVVERTEVDYTNRQTNAAPMWVWVLPLVLVVIALVWYVLTTGQPNSPVGSLPDVELEAPEMNAPAVGEPQAAPPVADPAPSSDPGAVDVPPPAPDAPPEIVN